MNYYAHHIKDFNNATRHLTRVERSLYRDLIELYYLDESPLIADTKLIARKVLARDKEEKEALDIVLDEFFILKDGFYYNDKCDDVIAKYHNTTSAKAIAGKASAEARRVAREELKQRNSTGVEQNSTGVEQNSTGVEQNSTGVEQVLDICATNQEPITNNQKPITNNQKPITKDKSIVKLQATLTRDIFEFWKLTMKSERSLLTKDRKKIIQKALNAGYSVEYIKLAITGCSLSEWNMGANDRQTEFNDLHIILKDAKNIERFMKIADKGGARAGRDAEIDAISQSAVDEFVGGGNMIEGEVVSG